MRVVFILTLFVFVGVLAAGTGYFKVQQEEKQQNLAELALMKKEKLIVLDMLKERDEELQLYKQKLADKVDDFDRQVEQFAKQKKASTKLAEMLSKTQKERDALTKQRDELSRPDSMPCSDALQTKDRAIAALVEERQLADSRIEKMKSDVKKFEKKTDAALAKLSQKEVEVDELAAWKEGATGKLLAYERADTSKSIWAASIEGRGRNCPVCPAPIPRLSKVEDVGALLEATKKKTGFEVGCGESMASVRLLQQWPSAKGFYCITEPEADSSSSTGAEAEAEPEESEAAMARQELLRIGGQAQVKFLHEFKPAMAGKLADESLDLLHIAHSYNHPLYQDLPAFRTVLESFWPKMKSGGLMVSGFVGEREKLNPKTRDAVMQTVEDFAGAHDRQLVRVGIRGWAVRA